MRETAAFVSIMTMRHFKARGPRLATFTAIILCLCAASQGQTRALVHDDNQIWTEYQLAIPFDNKTDFVAIGVVRFGRNVSRPVNERFGFGVSRKIGQYLTV